MHTLILSPGSSAQYMNLASMGPLILSNNLSLHSNDARLTTLSNVMFIDLLGSGFSFANNLSDLPKTYQQYSLQLTYAINAFIDETVMGKSQVIVLAGEGTFTRNLYGLNDITPLDGIIHLSPWPELYAIGKYYGVAGLDLSIFSNAQKIAIETTMATCYRTLLNKKYYESHKCYDSVLDFVQLKTNNVNLYNVHIGSVLTQSIPLIEYYFSQPNIVQQYGAPSGYFFQSQSAAVWNRTYQNLAINLTQAISEFSRDNYSIKHWFVTAEYDYDCYKPAILNWLQNELNFFERDQFIKNDFQDITVQGQKVGRKKFTNQISYTEFYHADHYLHSTDTSGFKSQFEQWLAKINSVTRNIRTQ